MSSKNQIHVDIDLLKKYDQPGPRYTSYPTAPYFHEGIGEKDYIRHIQKDDQQKSGEPISLYFHLPFCDTLCYFCGCNMMVTHNRQKIDHYIDYLVKEMELLRPLINDNRKVMQLHWGGGTPTYLTPEQIRRLGQDIRRLFELEEGAEVSVEIDPRELTREHMVALKEAGFNRCSMGVQDFNPKVQKTVNRIQPEDITRQTVDWARELGFQSVNIDLMYGLPFQNAELFKKTLEIILDIDPDRLAVFNYAHLPSIIKHQRLIKDEWLPGPEEKLELLKLSIETLTSSGYVYIGMDHFAKPNDELTIAMNEGTLYRNFQGYSTHAGLNLFAIGITSISMLSDLYVQNVKKLEPYYELLDAGHLPVYKGVELNEDDILRREVITELMCNFRLQKEKIEKKYGIVFDDYFADALQNLTPMQDDGLIELHADHLQVTTMGRLLIRNIAMQFDYYLMKREGHKPQFSRTV
ncbi:oxygen-independent coproporphyrinogen III oxidase [Caldithrix abyssi]|uniref:Coproporphyrinogen-III oxidase n=1 Tax=Caldithrix abyssi DSM 13497 TaxID=880073 RepID=H1XPE5_CALAY|nr:oxygen-independent coproporphyrinogen III oxidase [Caldithrix abyssi]APF19422.1 oxygen-independent coproporphyrinogen-3 oxidase [Caldithrix abyssi DSM 13497]EHO43316.1 oxygen-independent coproporphyrinogen III oxidase [Caldithrix abyssi DSM 13497]